jgi:hypothetical protein
MPKQKWNLGDIRPPQREARERGTLDGEVRQRRIKRPMQDMVAPLAHTPVMDTFDTFEEEDTSSSKPSRRSHSTDTPTGGRKKIVLCGIIVFVVLVVGFLATLFVQNAELTVYPKFKDVKVQATFSAYQNPQPDTLGYELLTLEETGERTVTATTSEDVTEQATGEITLYNAFSKDSQRLIKNTRFESADGKIFRIRESVMIPGYTAHTADTANDGPLIEGKVPGIIIVKVFADIAGDAYNIGPTRFTIPGFKGSPQFDAIYAESKAPMRGGFVGKKLIVDDATLTSAQQAIQTELKDTLIARLHNERPAGFALYETAAVVRFESLPSVDAGDKQATIREHAILEAPLFAEADFARYLAQNTIVGYGNEDVRLENAQSLKFSYVMASSTEALKSALKIDFNLTGNTKIVWTYDLEKLRQELIGVSKDEALAILHTKYQPAIERATTVMRPFWKQSFPKNPAKIKIIEILDSQSE